MRILLDECMPPALPESLYQENVIQHTRERGWNSLKNGELLRAANVDFDVLLTVDKNMPYQQSLKGLTISVVVLDIPDRKLETFERFYDLFVHMKDTIQPGTFHVVELPTDEPVG